MIDLKVKNLKMEAKHMGNYITKKKDMNFQRVNSKGKCRRTGK